VVSPGLNTSCCKQTDSDLIGATPFCLSLLVGLGSPSSVSPLDSSFTRFEGCSSSCSAAACLSNFSALVTAESSSSWVFWGRVKLSIGFGANGGFNVLAGSIGFATSA